MKVLNVLLGGGGPDVAFRAYLLTAVRRLHIDKVRSTQRATTDRRPDPVRPGSAVHRHRRGRVRGRCGRQGVRLPPRALADGALAPRGGEPEAGRHRSAAGDERQLGLCPRLPGPRGSAPGVPEHAQRRPGQRRLPGDQWAARRLRPRRPLAPGRHQGRGPPRALSSAAPPPTSSCARSTPRSPRCWARRCSAGRLPPTSAAEPLAPGSGQERWCSSAGARTSFSPTPLSSAATAAAVGVVGVVGIAVVTRGPSEDPVRRGAVGAG